MIRTECLGSLRSVWFWYHCKKRKKEFIVDRNVIFFIIEKI